MATALLVSDLHLDNTRPDITRAFLSFLTTTATTADSLYLLGDIFEAWIGDDAPVPAMQPVFDALITLQKQGCSIYFQHGNRDFLVSTDFLTRLNIQLLEEEAVVNLPSGQALLMHGDQLCTDDKDYQVFRSQVRNASWQRQFLAKSLTERMAIAQQLREGSRQSNQTKDLQIMDTNPSTVASQMQKHHSKVLIHGHTHRPAVHHSQIAAGIGIRMVLGDWDKARWYIRSTEQGINLIEEPLEH